MHITRRSSLDESSLLPDEKSSALAGFAFVGPRYEIHVSVRYSGVCSMFFIGRNICLFLTFVTFVSAFPSY